MYGKDLTVQSCKNLRNEIDIFECDGVDMLKKLKDHDWHSILFLNIYRYLKFSLYKNEMNFYVSVTQVDKLRGKIKHMVNKVSQMVNWKLLAFIQQILCYYKWDDTATV